MIKLKQDFRLTLLSAGVMGLTASSGMLVPSAAHAYFAANTNTSASPTASITVDIDAWSQGATHESALTGPDLGKFHYTNNDASVDFTHAPTFAANAPGQRWFYPDKNPNQSLGTLTAPAQGNDASIAATPTNPTTILAAQQWRYLGPFGQDTSVGGSTGVAIHSRSPGNTGADSSFAAGYAQSTWSSTAVNDSLLETSPIAAGYNGGVPDGTGAGNIGLGLSWRIHSDYNEPTGTVWWKALTLNQDAGDGLWRIMANSGPGSGSIFQLTNVVEAINPANGLLHLEGDYWWGDATDAHPETTAWFDFLEANPSVFGLPTGDGTSYTSLDRHKIFGHVSVNAPVPLPSAIWLFGSALAGLVSFKRRER